MQDIIASDARPAGYPLNIECPGDLGTADLELSRYTDAEFFSREIDHLWTRVWQWACREEHIPNNGDYVVYDVGPHSVIVLRDQDGVIRAFVNSCPHRGMQLCESGRYGRGKQFLRCPFHGMSWHLNGSLRDIPCDWDFAHVDPRKFGLSPVRCERWGGFVFINLDADAPALQDYLGVLPEHFRNWPLEDRYVASHIEKILPANWKTAVEAFLEAFHILATHPEGLTTAGDANAQYDVFDDHVSRFVHAIAFPSPHLERKQTEAELFAQLGRDPQTLPAGAKARTEHAKRLRNELSQAWHVDLSHYSDSETLDSIEYFLFPNACFFPGLNIRLVYRFRPLDVDHTIHEVLLLQPVPKTGERPKPAVVQRLGIEDSYTQVPDFPLAAVLDQDTDNLARLRSGIKASRRGTQTLGAYQESRIRHLHATLDRYLGLPSIS